MKILLMGTLTTQENMHRQKNKQSWREHHAKPIRDRHAWPWQKHSKWRRSPRRFCQTSGKRRENARDDDVSKIPQTRNLVCDARGLGLCHWSVMVCDLLPRMGVYPVISWKVGPQRSPLFVSPLALVRSSGRAAALGLTPLRLPSAPV